MNNRAIGGYFELELPWKRHRIYPDALRVQSARSAFLTLLRAGKPTRVWMPHYLCDTMYVPLQKAGSVLSCYSVDQNFNIVDKPVLRPGEWIYCVNYFGICDAQIDALIDYYGRERVVVDNCQAFFSQPRECVATIFSPRKFFGVPDGGLLLSRIPIELPIDRDACSPTRATHLLQRLDSTPEAGYASYKKAEQTLEDVEPRRMSELTDVLLSTVDFENARLQRTRNFKILHEKLAVFNQCAVDTRTIDGPLCYPLLIDAPGLREHLISSRVFVATYWPDVLGRIEDTATEATLVKRLHPLPCDQRYDVNDMLRIVEVCLDFMSAKTTSNECEEK